MSDGSIADVIHLLTGVTARLDGLDQRLDGLSQRPDAFGSRLEALEAKQEDIEARNAERHAELMGNNRRLEAKVDRLEVRVDRLHDDMMDVKVRLTQADATISHWGGTIAVQSGRQDRFEARNEMIEKRMELRDSPPP